MNRIGRAISGVAIALAGILMLAGCGENSSPVESTGPGVISNFAGEGSGFNPDAQTRSEARFDGINDLRVVDDWLYVADTGNNVIARINLADARYEILAGDGRRRSISGIEERGRLGPMPIVLSLDVDHANGYLYAVVSEPGAAPRLVDSALVRMELDGDEIVILETGNRWDGLHRDVRMLSESELLFTTEEGELFVYDLPAGESRQALPGVEVASFSVGQDSVAYLATAGRAPEMLELDFKDGSTKVLAGTLTTSPLLEQIRDDAASLQNAPLVASEMVARPDSRIAVLDDNRFGKTIGIFAREAGTFAVVAGAGPEADTGDGGPATEAEITRGPIAFDAAGNLYLGASTRIRRINAPVMVE